MVDKILDNFAVLLLEIIGYIATPIYFIILVCLLNSSLYQFLVEFPEINSLVLIIGIYSLGYVFRATSGAIGEWKWFAIKDEIVKKIEASEVYKIVKKEFAEKINLEVSKISFSDVRNIEMSNHPEIADKAYLFMFRANLFLDILVINIIVSTMIIIYYLLLLILSLFDGLAMPFEIITLNSIVLVIVTIFLHRPLKNARRVFFRMSYSIPITHFLGREKL